MGQQLAPGQLSSTPAVVQSVLSSYPASITDRRVTLTRDRLSGVRSAHPSSDPVHCPSVRHNRLHVGCFDLIEVLSCVGKIDVLGNDADPFESL